MALEDYLETLKKRAKESHVYRPFQLQGLEIAEILGDEKHKSLYIKLAKECYPDLLIILAKNVAEKKDVKNRGAYFMAVLKKDKKKYERARNIPARPSRRGKGAARKNKTV